MRYRLLPIILLVLSVVSVALFGFRMIEHGMGHEVGGCIASLGRVAPCPEAASSVPSNFLTFHLEILKIFSVTSDFVKIMALLFIVFTILALRLFKPLWPGGSSLSSINSVVCRHLRVGEFFTSREKCLRRWLAIHEKRDPDSALWAHVPINDMSEMIS